MVAGPAGPDSVKVMPPTPGSADAGAGMRISEAGSTCLRGFLPVSAGGSTNAEDAPAGSTRTSAPASAADRASANWT